MNRRKLGILVALVVILVVLGAAATVREIGEWTFQYTTMPPNDDELRQWVADQPGIATAEVSRDQAGIRVHYSTPLWVALRQGGFPISDFMAACERAGYKDFRGWHGGSHVGWSK